METSQPMDGRYPVRVNGIPVQQTVLLPDDQIGIGMHRFLVEAPGLEPEPEIACHPRHRPLPEEPPDRAAKSGG